MTKKKETRRRLKIGDAVEVRECAEIGLLADIIRGVLIWKPMYKDIFTPQFYCIWVSGLSQDERNNQAAMIENARQATNINENTRYTISNGYKFWLWNTFQNLDRHDEHLLFVPVSKRSDIHFISSETEDLIPGDVVLDRRWYSRFVKNAAKTVLTLKYDETQDMNRVCVENPATTRKLSFGNWVYPVLRKDLIKISRRNIPKVTATDFNSKAIKSVLQMALSRIVKEGGALYP